MDRIELKNNSLNEILIDYFRYLRETMDLFNKKNNDYIYSIVELLDLKKLITSVSFNSSIDCTGYYSFENKELAIDFTEMFKFLKLGIITESTFYTEYLTSLLHEFVHALQYKSLIDDRDSHMAIMKQLSIEFKGNLFDSIEIHHMIPDEREANIESSKIVYTFFKKYFAEFFAESNDNLIFYLCNGYGLENGEYASPFSKLIFNRTLRFIENYSIMETFSDYEKLIYGLRINDNLQKELEASRKTKKLDNRFTEFLRL